MKRYVTASSRRRAAGTAVNCRFMSDDGRLIAVTDTNFWIHTKLPFDFMVFLGVADPIVVIITTVVDKLDRLRATGTSRQIRDRSRAVLNELRALMQDGRRVIRRSDGKKTVRIAM